MMSWSEVVPDGRRRVGWCVSANVEGQTDTEIDTILKAKYYFKIFRKLELKNRFYFNFKSRYKKVTYMEYLEVKNYSEVTSFVSK